MNWIHTEHSRDFGFDYWVYLKDKLSDAVQTGFLVQLKTTAKAQKSDGNISIILEGKNIHYYNNIACPLMLVFCDLSECKDKPEHGQLYYSWYTNILLIPSKNYYSIKIPLSNKLTRELDINEEVEKIVSSYQAFVLNDSYERSFSPQKFKKQESFADGFCSISTSHIRLKAFIPTIDKIDRGSCLFTFALPGAEECMITFSHERILSDLFSGSLNIASSIKKGFVVFEKYDDGNWIIVQLGNCRFMFKRSHVYELSSLVSRLYYQYIKSLKRIEFKFKLKNFTYDSEMKGFKLITVPIDIWLVILDVAEEYEYNKGTSEWHIFYKISDYSFSIETLNSTQSGCKFFAQITAVKEYNRDLNRLDSNVVITWKYPSYRMHHKDIGECWDLEYCYNWFVNKLLPFVIGYGKKKLV